MDWWQLLILAGVGLVAGMLNVLAAGGSLLTLPVMILLGLPPALANGTNRVAILVQNVTAVARFRRSGRDDLRLSLTLGLCALPGAVIGAATAVVVDPLLFKRILVAVLLGSLLLVVTGRHTTDPSSLRRRPVAAHLAMVAAGFYGGFIQAGVGFLLIAIVNRLLALDLVRVTMHKVAIIGLYTVPALLVFALNGEVSWLAGAALAAGNASGAALASGLALRRGEGLIRAVFVAAVVVMCIKLLVS